MTTNQPDRLDRIEAALERMIQFQASFAVTQEQHERRIAQNEAMIVRLDAILERLIYREGRDERA